MAPTDFIQMQCQTPRFALSKIQILNIRHFQVMQSRNPDRSLCLYRYRSRSPDTHSPSAWFSLVHLESRHDSSHPVCVVRIRVGLCVIDGSKTDKIPVLSGHVRDACLRIFNPIQTAANECPTNVYPGGWQASRRCQGFIGARVCHAREERLLTARCPREWESTYFALNLHSTCSRPSLLNERYVNYKLHSWPSKSGNRFYRFNSKYL